MKIKYLLLLITLALLQIGCDSTSVKSQTSESNGGRAIVVDNRPNDEAKVSGEFERTKLDNATEEAIKQQSAPQFLLNFQCSNNDTNCVNGELRRELPAEAQVLVADYWKWMLDYGYVRMTDKAQLLDAETDNKITNRQIAKSTNFESNMLKVEVDAPTGRRKLSGGEVDQIFSVINSRACQTVQQTDVCKIYDPETKEWRVKKQ